MQTRLRFPPAGTTGAPGLAQHQRRASARRSLGTKFAATAATGDSSSDGSGGSSSSSSPPRQQQYKVGASVYDASHHGASSCRGYGRIVGGADIADDGTQRWKVEWEKEGSRIKPIKETYLELSLIDHRRRTPPSGLDQPILVVLGTHKGKTGVTKKKVGMGDRGWDCSRSWPMSHPAVQEVCIAKLARQNCSLPTLVLQQGSH